MTNNPKYYLTVDAEAIKTDLMAYINSKNQYGAMYGPKSHKKGITVEKVIYRTNED
jgi:hypothetical protein